MSAPADVPSRLNNRSSLAEETAELPKLVVVLPEVVFKLTVGIEGKLFKTISLAPEPVLVIVVTPLAEVISKVAVPVELMLNVSTDVELTATVVLRVAVNTSVPVPPVSVSPLLKLFAVVASKVSAALAPLRLSRPVVKVNVFAASSGLVSFSVMLPVAVTSADN